MNVPTPVRPDEIYRLTRERLDWCLNILEAAIEKGDSLVSTEIATNLSPYVPSVVRGLPLADALELVFASQQELFSHQTVGGHMPELLDSLVQSSRGENEGEMIGVAALHERLLTKTEAEELTARIKHRLRELPDLLLEAHERRAWMPLGYQSWEHYVRTEFRLSRSRSYELLDQARVVRALQAAAGDREVPPISSLAAIQIKPRLNDVVAQVRSRVCDGSAVLPSGEVERIVQEAVRRARTRSTDIRAFSEPPLPATSGETRLSKLVRAIAVLAAQPPVADVLTQLSDAHTDLMTHLPAASQWLNELLAAISARSRALEPGTGVTQASSANPRGGRTRRLTPPIQERPSISASAGRVRSVRDSGQSDLQPGEERSTKVLVDAYLGATAQPLRALRASH